MARPLSKTQYRHPTRLPPEPSSKLATRIVRTQAPVNSTLRTESEMLHHRSYPFDNRIPVPRSLAVNQIRQRDPCGNGRGGEPRFRFSGCIDFFCIILADLSTRALGQSACWGSAERIKLIEVSSS